MNLKIHDKRVMSCHLSLDLLYTISEDKSFKVTTISTSQTIFSNSPSNQPLNSLIRDQSRLFLSDSTGQILIYDITKPQPQLLNKIKNQKGGVVRALVYDPVRNYLLAGSLVGEISIFDI